MVSEQETHSCCIIFYDDCSDAFINKTDATLESISNKIPHNITHLPINSSRDTPKTCY